MTNSNSTSLGQKCLLNSENRIDTGNPVREIWHVLKRRRSWKFVLRTGKTLNMGIIVWRL